MVEGFKHTEVGVIPNDWKVIPISEITSLMTNGFVGTVKSHYTDYENGILYIQGYNVEENSFNYNGIKRVTEEFHKKHLKSCLQKGDLLTIQTGDIGVTTVVPEHLAGSNCHALIITRFKKGTAEPKFYSYYFNFSAGRRRLKEIETGSTMKHINVGDMIQLLIPYPTKAEQTAIATALNDADALIQKLEQLIAKKRNIKTGAMQELLKPKEGWEENKLGEVAKFRRGSFPQPYGLDKWYDDKNGFPFVQVYDVDTNMKLKQETKSKISEEAQKMSVFVKKGSIVLTIQGSIGRIAMTQYDAYVDRTLLLFESFLSPFNSYFFMLLVFVLFEQEKLNAPGGTIKTITKEALSSFKIAYPKLELQNQIAQILSDMDNEIQELVNQMEKYKMMKQGMMQSLLTGKIRLV